MAIVLTRTNALLSHLRVGTIGLPVISVLQVGMRPEPHYLR